MELEVVMIVKVGLLRESWISRLRKVIFFICYNY